MKSKDLRTKAVQELLKTEESYINQLDTLKRYFVDPSAGLIAPSVHTKLFGELPALQALNKELYSKLCQPLKDGSDLRERKCYSECDSQNFLQVNVGEAFLEIAPFFKAYASYASNYQQNLELIQEQENQHPKFHSFLRNSEARPEVQCKLVSLLIVPIQRLPRYTLLLTEILRHLPHGHPYKDSLERSVSVVASAAQRVDDCVGEGEHMHRLLCLQRALSSQKPNIIIPGRKLLKSGLLHKANRSDGNSVPRIFFLFTDMLMYTKVPTKQRGLNNEHLLCDMSSIDKYKTGSLVCCCVLPLRHCTVLPLFAQDDNTSVFKVICNAEELTVHSKLGKPDGQAWISSLRSAITVAVTNRKTLKKDSSAKRPLRRPDIKRGMDSSDSLQQLKVSSPRTILSPIASSPTPSTSSASSTLAGSKSSSTRTPLRKYLKPPQWWGSNNSVSSSPSQNNSEKKKAVCKGSSNSRTTDSNVGRFKSLLRPRKRNNEPIVNVFDENVPDVSPFKMSVMQNSPSKPCVSPYKSRWEDGLMSITPEKSDPNSLSTKIKPKLIGNKFLSNTPTGVNYNSQRPFSYFPGKTLPNINGSVRPVFNSDKLMTDNFSGEENYATVSRRKRNARRRSRSLSSFKVDENKLPEKLENKSAVKLPCAPKAFTSPQSRTRKRSNTSDDINFTVKLKKLSKSVETLNDAEAEVWKRDRIWPSNKLFSFFPKN